MYARLDRKDYNRFRCKPQWGINDIPIIKSINLFQNTVVTLRESFFIVLFYLGNGLPMLVNATFYAVLPVLKGDVGMSDSLIGNMRSLMAIAFASSKLVSGPAIDTYGPRIIWSAAMGTLGVCQIVVAAAHSDSTMQVVMCVLLQKFCQGFCWTLVVVSVSSHFQGSKFTTALGIVSTSARVFGALGGFLASAFLGSPGGWHKAVQICAVACFIQAILLFMFLTPVKKKQDTVDGTNTITAGKIPINVDKSSTTSAEADDANIDTSARSKPDNSDHQPRVTEVLSVAFSSRRMLLFILFSMLALPHYSLEENFPTYFVAQGMPAQDAARVSAGSPAGMAIVLPLAGWFSGRFPKLASGLFPISIGLSGILLFLLSNLDLSSSSPTEASYMQNMAQALLCVIGFCFAPAMYFPPAQFANTYGGERNKGLIVGIMDFAGCLVISLYNFLLPSLVSLVGWSGVLACNASMLVMASLVIGYLQWWQAVDPVRALAVIVERRVSYMHGVAGGLDGAYRTV